MVHRIEPQAVTIDLVVEMRDERVAGHAHVTYDGSPGHLLSARHQDVVQMGVPRDIASVVRDFNHIALPLAGTDSTGHYPVGGSLHRSTLRRKHVQPVVFHPDLIERIDSGPHRCSGPGWREPVDRTRQRRDRLPGEKGFHHLLKISFHPAGLADQSVDTVVDVADEILVGDVSVAGEKDIDTGDCKVRNRGIE